MPINPLAAPPRTRTAYEHVRATLRAAILDRTLSAGERLVQSELASQLGVSTTPVREALRDLATEGLVLFDSHRGAIVRPLNIDEVREIYELRMTLEPIMVRRVIERITDEQLARAADLAAQMRTESDMSTWVNLNRAFHGVFTEIDDKSRLATILAGLRDSAAGYVAVSLDAQPRHIAEANAEHEQLLDIYRRRDADAAIELTLQHLRSTLAIIEEAHTEGLL
ncbi:GntR family transcriptional regulator [Pseudonocardia acaciae]|uniref:GntR family transcriptional regulator n=1 Tax=Pseudonocardia acaciae TaxID=551276 RepID=UPI0006867A64|nr:GntR family transcriptional regulator [Pseudonocardia acaciae]